MANARVVLMHDVASPSLMECPSVEATLKADQTAEEVIDSIVAANNLGKGHYALFHAKSGTILSSSDTLASVGFKKNVTHLVIG